MLIVGCGDIGLRVLRLLGGRLRVLALTSSPGRTGMLRAAGAVPLQGDLDQPASLARLAGMADAVLHLAPPPGRGRRDPRTAALLAALARSRPAPRLVYASTSGVYGDCEGRWVDEATPLRPGTERAWRRVDAEARVRHYGRSTGARVTILRVPGIYAADRPGGDPRQRARAGLPVLRREDDVYTNHIHADDLARACVAALWRGRAQRVVNASDDTQMLMGDYLDLAADAVGAARPPRLSRAEARLQLDTQRYSFMAESRRLDNRRLKQELRVSLRWPTVASVLISDDPSPGPI
ncbi:MAG: NAD-dependent epimerase/dehydratase family protein [Aquabacterium sp.]